MINEKEKLYIICNYCCKTDNCEYYNQVINTAEEFKNSPLNIHFPMCNNYQSSFNKMLENIEAEDVVVYKEIFNIKEDDNIVHQKIFNKNREEK